MMIEDGHLPDATLLLDADGELAPSDEKRVHAHLSACWRCRARRAELELAIQEFVRMHRAHFEPMVPSADGPRALLKARMAASTLPSRRSWLPRVFSNTAWIAVSGVLIVSFVFGRITAEKSRLLHRSAIVFAPESRLTPGATVLTDKAAVCAAPDIKNKSVTLVVQQQVFAEYGITGSDPAKYEVDYLVTPALGGSDDIRNLWPHSYNAVWNARVKDDLEDRLREMVCQGQIDLQSAQRDIATDWIAAYKRIFHTDEPIQRQ